MKSPLFLTSLVLAAGSTLAFVGSTIVPWITLPTVIAGYAAAGALAFAIRDYSRQTTYDAPRARRHVHQPEQSPQPVGLETTFGWTHQTISS